MNIAVFSTNDAAGANEFINSVQLEGPQVEVKDGDIVVYYKPEVTEEAEVAKRLRNAKSDLIQFQVHDRYLKSITVRDHVKHQDAVDNNERAITNVKAAIELFENWDKPETIEFDAGAVSFTPEGVAEIHVFEDGAPKKKAAKK